jgi:hypothetical protein
MSRPAMKRFQLTAPVVAEHDIQRVITNVLRLEIAREGHVSEHGVCWFSIDMANSHDAVPGIRIARGIPAGVPDIIVLYQGRAGWIELKTRALEAELSSPQRSLCATLLLSGCRIGVARDADEVLGVLDSWQIPRKRRVRVAA